MTAWLLPAALGALAGGALGLMVTVGMWLTAQRTEAKGTSRRWMTVSLVVRLLLSLAMLFVLAGQGVGALVGGVVGFLGASAALRLLAGGPRGGDGA